MNATKRRLSNKMIRIKNIRNDDLNGTNFTIFDVAT